MSAGAGFIWLIGGLVFAWLAVAGCGRGTILGPSGRPSVLSKEWAWMEVSYRVRVSANATRERSFRIDDAATIQTGRTKMTVREVEPNNLGVSGNLRIQTADGDEWLGETGFENEIDLCLAADTYYSYHVTLRSTAFYEWLRRLCLRHLREEYPNAQLGHVILRTTLVTEAYEILGPP